jgi:branched-subunit amino acid transport protein AzlD
MRGIVIVLMIVTVFIIRFDFMPFWIGHLPPEKNGVGFADLGMVAFVFMLSMMMAYNYKRSVKEKGLMPTVRRYITRGFSLIGIGFLLMYVIHF